MTTEGLSSCLLRAHVTPDAHEDEQDANNQKHVVGGPAQQVARKQEKCAEKHHPLPQIGLDTTENR